MKKSHDQNIDFTDWYNIWMKQSKEFFDTADKSLKQVFENKSSGGYPNPEEYIKQIQQWQDTLKNQWQYIQLNEQQKAFEDYWKMMAKMCSDASDMMVEQWIKRSHEQNPVKNIRELYELWLNCCHEVYQRSTTTSAYQKAYGDFMNAAMKFWKSAIPK